MSPLGIGSSNSTNTLTTGEAKLWILLVGINEYQDNSLPNLRYPAVDCQALAEALAKATQGFPNKEVIIHHDFAVETPTLETVRESLEKIVSKTQPTDSILLYFSGHGILEPDSQQVVLCLADTKKDNLLTTGFALQEMLQILGTSDTSQQLVWLDTCHSGDMRLLGSNRGGTRDGNISETLLNPTPQMMDVFRKRAAQSKGFCALLSCDQGQQSWEFPELGHGVFTYYLMRGLLGEAADAHGIIEADGLYKYVHRQTLQYIEKLNHQLRLINKQKLDRGDCKLYPEYPLQTPKRIVEGVGEIILGFKPDVTESDKQRRALVIDGLSNKETTTKLSQLFAGAGGFEVEFFPQQNKSWSDIKGTIQEFLHWNNESAMKSPSHLGVVKSTPTSLLYLRGHIEEIEDGEAWLILGNGVRLSRSWLRQKLRCATKTQKIIILDCPETNSLESWIEDLRCGIEHGQCIIGAAATAKGQELFSQTLLETLVSANPQVGLSVSKWIAELQKRLPTKDIKLDVWVSETEAVIDILPGNIHTVFQKLQQLELPVSEVKKQKDKESLQTKTIDNISNFELAVLPSHSPTPVTGEPLEKVKPQVSFTISAEQYTELEHLLRQLIGPIAPLILQKALKAANCEELKDKLAHYLLPEQQEKFWRQAIIILEKPISSSQKNSHNSQISEVEKQKNKGSLQTKTIDNISNFELAVLPSHSPTPVTGEPLEKVKPQFSFTISAEQYTELEHLLRQLIGPIASIILQKALKAANCEELVDNLAHYLLPEQQEKFWRQAMIILEKPISSSQKNSHNSQIIESKFISKCEQTLFIQLAQLLDL